MLALLIVAAFVGGIIDAIAGGGGLITLPALLAAGLDPRVALATNKGQAVFGSSTSLVSFARHGLVDRHRAVITFPLAVLGALAGARLVLMLSPSVLQPVVVVLLVFAALLSFLRRPSNGVIASPRGKAKGPMYLALTASVALCLGAYDGFFGPGVGTFLLLIYAYGFKDTLVEASGNAKVANFASNFASFSLFAYAGAIAWRIAVPMGIAQAAGSWLGARLAVRRGEKLVRITAVFISLALAARVATQMMFAH